MTSPESSPLDITFDGAAAWFTLNRPAALNAITPALLSALSEALARATADPACRAIVLRAAGRAFCAGADLKVARQVFGDDSAATMAFLRDISALCDRLEDCPKPVIASIQGLALAGGLELVLACDLVIASTSAAFGDAHANFGLLPGGGGSVRLPRKVGVNQAKQLMFTGRNATAHEMAVSGLVTELTTPEALEEQTRRLVEQIAARSPLGLRRMKFLVDKGLDQPRATAMQLELLVNELHNLSADRAEGLAAFEERRAPVFTGR